MSTPAPLPLYRSMLRLAKQVNDYNFRSHAVRRVKTGFRLNRNLQGYVAVFLVVCERFPTVF